MYRLSLDLNKIIQETYVPHLSDVTFEGVKLQPPVQIPWLNAFHFFLFLFLFLTITVHRYPEGFAWQLDVPKSAIRRSPEFKRFHNFLVYETDVVGTLISNVYIAFLKFMTLISG